MPENLKSILATARPEHIELSKIDLWKEANVRKTDVFTNLEDLADNIRAIGLQVPLVVKEEKPNERYLVISGQRRFRACQIAHIPRVPCLVIKRISLEDAMLLSLSENLYRQPMNDDDLADASFRLNQRLGGINAVASALGVSVGKVRKYLGYRNVSKDLKELVREKKITVSQATRINSAFTDEAKKVQVAKELAKLQSRTKKSKLYEAVRESPPDTDIKELRKKAEEMERLVAYEIHLPPRTSKALEKVAAERGVQPLDLIVDIIEWWASETEAGRSPRID